MGQYRQLYRLNRTRKHAWAMLRTLMDQIIIHEKITTTCAKAKAVWPILNSLLNFAKKKTPYAYQKVNSTLRTPQAKSKVFHKLVLRYKEISGNLVKIVDTGFRRKGDKARMFHVQLMNGPHQAREENHIRQLQKVMDIYPADWESAIRNQELQYYINQKVQSEKIMNRFKSEIESLNKGNETTEDLKTIFEDEMQKLNFNDRQISEINQLIVQKEKEIDYRNKKGKKDENFDEFLKRSSKSQYNDYLIHHARSQLFHIEKIMRHSSGSLRYQHKMIQNYALDEMIDVLERNAKQNEKYDKEKDKFWKDEKKKVDDLRKAKLEAKDKILKGEATLKDVETLNKRFMNMWTGKPRNGSRLTERSKRLFEENKDNPNFQKFWVDIDGIDKPDPDYKGPKRVPFYKKKSDIMHPDEAYEFLNQELSDAEEEIEFVEKNISQMEYDILPRTKNGKGSPNKL